MKNGIVVVGASFVDIKGYPLTNYVPNGRNAGRVLEVHGGVSRNVVEDIANVELRRRMGWEPGLPSLIMTVMSSHLFRRGRISQRLAIYSMRRVMKSFAIAIVLPWRSTWRHSS